MQLSVSFTSASSEFILWNIYSKKFQVNFKLEVQVQLQVQFNLVWNSVISESESLILIFWHFVFENQWKLKSKD